MEGYSQTPKKERLDVLKAVMPEVFDEGRVNWEKLKAALGEDIEFSNERYVLNWAGKSDAFRVMQRPTKATLVPCREESVDFDTAQNIFIEGENMEVLKVLQKSYFGKIKMIYIDPPYNTGNDSFVYPDNFSESKQEYLQRIGDKDADGYMLRDAMFHRNSKENGQFHSNWLNMMMPRLYLAKSLLREDGVIFVSIDDHEVHNLRLLMNEIFGEENFVGDIVWKNKYGAGAKTVGFVEVHEFILCYSKHPITNVTSVLDYEGQKVYNKKDDKFAVRGGYMTQPLMTNSLGDRPNLMYSIEYNGVTITPNKQWVWNKERLMEAIANGEVEFNKQKNGSYSVRSKAYLYDDNGVMRRGKPLSLMNGPFNQEGTKEMRNLFDDKSIFDFTKPSQLISYLVSLDFNDSLENDFIVLDFFAGSGTTAHAVMELNQKDGGKRKFICVQIPELCDKKSEAYKAGYKTIAEISKERIRRAGAKISKELEEEQMKRKEQLAFEEEVVVPDIGFKVFKLADSNFKQWREIRGSETESWKQQVIDFVDPLAEHATIDNMVYELLLRSGKELNSSVQYMNGFHSINNHELILLLESVSENIIDEVMVLRPNKIIALDRLFEGNDQLKTNTALQLRDAGIEFKTI